MQNQEVFETSLKKATAIRSYIQEKLRKEYNALSKAYSIITGADSSALKFYTDILYYRSGGYPTEKTLSKHEQYTIDFVTMVKFLEFFGLKKILLDPILQKHGINITVDKKVAFENFYLNGDKTIKAQNHVRKILNKKDFKIKAKTHYELLREIMGYTLELQGQICQASDVIKYDLTKKVEKSCDINKADFKDSIQFEIDLKKNKVNSKTMEKQQIKMKSHLQVHQHKITKVISNKKASRK